MQILELYVKIVQIFNFFDMEKLFGNIEVLARDNKINWKDNEIIDIVLENLKQDINENTRKKFLEVFEESLKKWYTITNENDYEVFKKILKIIKNDNYYKYPPFSKLKVEKWVTTMIYDWGDKIFVHNNSFWLENKQIRRMGSIDLLNGEIDLSELWNNTIDDISNNNQIELSGFFPDSVDWKPLPNKPTITKLEDNWLLMRYYWKIDNVWKFQWESIITWINWDVLRANFINWKMNGHFKMSWANWNILIWEAEDDKVINSIEYDKEGKTYKWENTDLALKKEKSTINEEDNYLKLYNNVNVGINWVRSQILAYKENFDYTKLTKDDIKAILIKYQDKDFPEEIENWAQIIFALQWAMSILLGDKNSLGVIDWIYGKKTKKSLKTLQKEILWFKWKDIDWEPGKKTIKAIISVL